MCLAVTTTWRNTGVTPEDIIRRVFYRQPYLVCILANKAEQGQQAHLVPPTTPTSSPRAAATTPTQPDPSSNPRPAQTDYYGQSNKARSRPSARPPQRLTMGGRRMHQLRQRRTDQPREHRRVPTIHRVPRYSEQTPVLLPNKDLQRGNIPLPPQPLHPLLHQPRIQPRILCSDYYITFRSTKANQFFEDHQCRHKSSAPYQQWQNAVERDIQTILSNISATICPTPSSRTPQLE